MISTKPKARHRRACRPVTPLHDLTNTMSPVRSLAVLSATGVAMTAVVPGVANAAELTSLDLNDSKEVLVTEAVFQAEANPALQAPADLQWVSADQVAVEVVTPDQVEEEERAERERKEREAEEARAKEAERREREIAANRNHQRVALENQNASEGTPQAANYSIQPAANNGHNAYPWGQCTWGAKALAPWAGNNWGNAASWAWNASAQGYRVGTVPQVGAIAVWSGNHVAVVVEVNSANSIRVMEANFNGNPNIGDYRGFFDPTTAQGAVTYIYPN
ncbi:CHAP domain-containing protein [Gleimia sp. 6138-11-ORH1]|uniref:CHAP domain-containing protein n=1 Tax=Gleimia sp. 6138-11-ORH1 TaxID=2973937 RepID=UPI002168D430|nr:CHAP domain-containing protein [Gleimia sp. 6138-11-ORH1]MCS4484749.1 CHAP domain-containing protein [Gleimia sp. 6138-11-ORH1]